MSRYPLLTDAERLARLELPDGMLRMVLDTDTYNEVDDQFAVSLDSSGESLYRRGLKRQVTAAPLRETIAAAMLILAGYSPPEPLVDPMCGAGTIPVEAKRINPALEVHGSDWDAETLDVARGTVRNHGLDVELRPADARELRAAYSGSFDYLVTDPPYGVNYDPSWRNQAGQSKTKRIGKVLNEQSTTHRHLNEKVSELSGGEL